MRIAGVLPMVGAGRRLGLPFPKPLVPLPLRYGHRTALDLARHHLRSCDTVTGLISTEDKGAWWGDLSLAIKKGERGEAADTIRWAGQVFRGRDGIAVILPDIIWHPGSWDLIADAILVYEEKRPDILLITGPRITGSTLDRIVWDDMVGWIVTDKEQAQPGGWGWFAFIAKPAFLRKWDRALWGPNIMLTNKIELFDTEIEAWDIGTPERYEKIWVP